MYFEISDQVNAETESQISDLTELRDRHRRRLQELLLSSATMGVDTPAHVNIEIDTIRGKVVEIDKTIGMLHRQEATWATRMLTAESGATVATPAELEQQNAAIARYIVMLEDGVRKDIGGIYHLIATESEIDTSNRKIRQYQTNIFYLVIIFLLCGIFIVVLLK